VDSSFPHKFSADFEGGEKDRFNNNMAGLALNFIPQKRKNPSFVKILASAYNGDESETFDILSYFKVSKLELDLKGGKPKEMASSAMAYNTTMHGIASKTSS
jgi:hypothetical protein